MRKRYFHRRNLPHLHYNEGDYFVTFRLKDSLPLDVLTKHRKNLEKNSEELSIKEKRLFKKYDELLDSGKFGAKYLMDEIVVSIIRKAIHKYDTLYYQIICYCIMPNHLHLVFTILDIGKSLSDIMKIIKGSTAITINRQLNREGVCGNQKVLIG